ncbi:MAG: PilZ domain-containing protein, partial [Myxococcales bacterium]
MNANRRRHNRVPASGLSTHYKVRNSVVLGMPVENISVGGLFVRTDTPLPVGHPLLLELVLPGSTSPVKLSGRVVTVSKPAGAREAPRPVGMGIRFDPLPDATYRQLEQLVRGLSAAAGQEPPKAPSAFVDESMEAARKATFDFKFTSLEALAPEEPPPPAAVPPLAAPAERAVGVPESAKLMLQVRGLLLDVGTRDEELRRCAREIEELRGEVERLQHELAARDQLIAQ